MPSITDNWRAFLVSSLVNDYPDAPYYTMADLEHRYYTKQNGLAYPPLLTIADLKYASYTAGIDDPQDGLILLSTAEGFWDARNYSGSGNWLNQGIAGSLDLQMGSTSGADSNDPTFLAYSGEPYVYVPGTNNSAIQYNVPDGELTRYDIDVKARVYYPTITSYSTNHIFSGPNIDLVNRGFDLVFNPVPYSFLTFTALPAQSGPTWIRLTRVAATGVVTIYLSQDGQNWTVHAQQTGTAGPLSAGSAGGYYFCTPSAPSFGRHYYLSINDQVIFDASKSGQLGYGGWQIVRPTGNVLKPVFVTRPCFLTAVDDYMTTGGTAAAMDIAASQPFTLFLACRKWGTPVNYHILASKSASGAANGYDLVNEISNTNVYGEIYASSVNAAGTHAPVADGSLDVIGMRRTAVGAVQTLQGGTSIAGGTSNAGSLSNTEAFMIAFMRSYSLYADMEIFGSAFFRRDLSDIEVQQVYAYFKGGTP